jgi:hypothetical protein
VLGTVLWLILYRYRCVVHGRKRLELSFKIQSKTVASVAEWDWNYCML